MPEYGNWKTFTTKDGLPANKVYCVRADGDRVWIGTPVTDWYSMKTIN